MLLDWAASGFSTVLITLIVAYVEKVVCADRPWGLEAGVVWPWTLALAMLVSAVLTPGLSAWADRRGRHKTALFISVATGAGAGVGATAAGRGRTAGACWRKSVSFC